MTDKLDRLEDVSTLIPKPAEEQRLAARRSIAGVRGLQAGGGNATRATDGEWMWRTALDLPEAMQLELEAHATTQGVTKDQVVREALVAFGIGDASHIAGICDGTHSDDDPQAELNTKSAWGKS